MIDYRKTFPHLFREYHPPNGSLRMSFELGTEFPSHLIGLVKMVAYIGDEYIAIREPDGWWEPGGKPEPGETYLDAIQREMLEETGTQVKEFNLFGAFHSLVGVWRGRKGGRPKPNSERADIRSGDNAPG